MNVLLTIWKKPTETLKYLIEEKTISYGLIIVMIASLGSGVMAFSDTGFLSQFSLPMILVISLGAALVGAIPFYFINAFMYTWIGKLLGGTGNWRKMCLAQSGAALVMIWTIPINFAAVAIYGKALYAEPGLFEVTNMSGELYTLYTVVLLVASIFGTVVTSKGIGLVHGFSAWRGFGTLMIYAGIAFVILFTIVMAVISGLLIGA